MDFSELLTHDPDEWRKIKSKLFGVAHSVASDTGSTLTPNDLVDIADQTFVAAMLQIAEIDPDKFWGWISKVAYQKTLARIKQKAGKKNIEGKSFSIEEKAEALGDEGILPFEVPAMTERQVEDRRELWNKLFALLKPADHELLLQQLVDDLKGWELAENFGWPGKDGKSASSRCKQAMDRVRKTFASDSRAATLLAALNMKPLRQ